MGYCPYCQRKLAPSAASCPECGNRQFQFKTGEERRELIEEPHLCENCCGKGYFESRRQSHCTQCFGSGQVMGVLWRKRCEKCHGSGFLYEPYTWTCNHCRGRKNKPPETLYRVIGEVIDTRTFERRWQEFSHSAFDAHSDTVEWISTTEESLSNLDDVDPAWRERLCR